MEDDNANTTTEEPSELASGPERLYLVGLTGPDAGVEFHLDRAAMVLGRGPGASLVVSDGAASRRHAQLLVVPDPAAHARRVVQVDDLESTNGLFVNGKRVSRATLQSGDKLAVGKTVFRLERRDDFDAAFYDRLRQMATTDALTGTGNRWSLAQELKRQESERQRYNRIFSIIIIDVDHFRRVNERCGHGGGDQALRAVAAVIAANLRDSDRLFRYGGDEFVVLLASTDAAGARRVAERIRGSVETLVFEHLAETVPLAVTIGGAEAGAPDVVDRADRALFLAKSEGRNRVRFDTDFK